jgi:EmrB/QacA subfamily drug resistance transporter
LKILVTHRPPAVPASYDPDVVPPAPAEARDEIVADPKRRMLILAAMCVALVGVVASISALNVAQQPLAVDLDASQSQLLWIINGYTLTLAALLMPVGAIGDRWGRKPILMLGLALFALSNLGAGFAASVEVLVALRVVTGMAAAMIMPVTLSVITTSFPIERRARAIGVWAGFAATGGVLGLFGSAAIIDNATWPWVFGIPVAFATISLVLTGPFVPHSREHAHAGFDVAGSLLSVVAVGGLVLAVQEGPERGWTSSLTVIALVAGTVGAVLFMVTSLRRDHPLLDMRIFADRSLTAGSLSLLVIFGVLFSLLLVLLQLFQAVFGYSALGAACGLLPLALVTLPLSIVAPTIAERVGLRTTLVVGLLILAGGLAAMALLVDAQRGFWSILPGLTMVAAGIGLCMSPSTAAITSSLPEEKQGVASALNDTVREIGGAIGIALLGSVLNATFRSNLKPTTTALPPDLAERASEGIGGALASAGQLGPDGAGLLTAAQNAFVDGMRPALLIGAAIAFTAAAFTAVRGPKHEAAEAISAP